VEFRPDELRGSGRAAGRRLRDAQRFGAVAVGASVVPERQLIPVEFVRDPIHVEWPTVAVGWHAVHARRPVVVNSESVAVLRRVGIGPA